MSKTWLFLILYIPSCNTLVEPSAVNNYPLTKNNVWNYELLTSATNFRPLQPGATIEDEFNKWTARVAAEGQGTIHDSIKTWKLSVRESGFNNFSGLQHYIVDKDTMWLYAYMNSSFAFPKHSPEYHFTIGGLNYSNSTDAINALWAEVGSSDTLHFESPPPPALIFPLSVGREWTFRTMPLRINKKIIGTEMVSTTAGNFACYKVQWFWDRDGDNMWDSLQTGYDYINEKGLIKRSIVAKNILLEAPNNPDPIGYIDLKHECVVSSIEGSTYPPVIIAGNP